MSKHHTLPPIVYTPPPKPKKIESKKQNFAEIEGADRKPRQPSGRLSQGTLSELLRVQEMNEAP
jgi:hypothetical protein